MSSDTASETFAADRWQADIARRIAGRLAALGTDTVTRARADSADAGARAAISRPDRRSTSEPDALADTVRAAIAEAFGRESLLLVLRDTDRRLAPIVAAVLERLPEAVSTRRRMLTEQHIEALVDLYLPVDPLATALPDLERDNAEAQAIFLRRWPVLTAEEVARRAGHEAGNRSATASRWKSARKIFGLRASRREVYPAFQFKDGRPRPIVAGVLGALPRDMSPWQIAFWFTGPNGWLEGDRPVDHLDKAECVVAAAAREGDAWIG